MFFKKPFMLIHEFDWKSTHNVEHQIRKFNSFSKTL